jgi:hypothetical protein
LDSDEPPVTDDGGVLDEGLDTDGLGDGLVAVRKRAGDCDGGGGAVTAGTKTFELGTNVDDVDSGSGSVLNTLSKRARLKCAGRSANPL